jgi:hypothetical protein
MQIQNPPVEQRSFNVTGTTQCAIILPSELRFQFKLCGFEAVSDKAGSALKVYEGDGLESLVLNTAGTFAGLSTGVTGTALPVDNGTGYNEGDLIVIVPFNWRPPNSPLCKDIPYVGVPRVAVVAAGSSANSINVTSAVTVYPFDSIYHLSPTVMRAIGAGTVTWPAPGQPRSWWTTGMGKTTLILLDGTEACSIPYLVVEKYIDEGNWID